MSDIMPIISNVYVNHKLACIGVLSLVVMGHSYSFLTGSSASSAHSSFSVRTSINRRLQLEAAANAQIDLFRMPWQQTMATYVKLFKTGSPSISIYALFLET